MPTAQLGGLNWSSLHLVTKLCEFDTAGTHTSIDDLPTDEFERLDYAEIGPVENAG